MSEKNYRLELLTPAQNELEAIALVHLELAGSLSAKKITNRICDSLELLKTAPNMGVSCADKPLKLPGYRMFICGNYLCIYRLIGDTVFVYHIVDGRADYPRLMNELSEQKKP